MFFSFLIFEVGKKTNEVAVSALHECSSDDSDNPELLRQDLLNIARTTLSNIVSVEVIELKVFLNLEEENCFLGLEIFDFFLV